MDGEERVRGPINSSLIVISSLTHVGRIVLPYLIQVTYDGMSLVNAELAFVLCTS